MAVYGSEKLIFYDLEEVIHLHILLAVDFADPGEGMALRRFLNALAQGRAVYADALRVDPTLFPHTAQYRAPGPEAQEARRASDRAHSFHLEPFDAMKLKDDLNEEPYVSLFFCDPGFAWADFLSAGPRRGHREMMGRHPIDACYGTGQLDGEYFWLKLARVDKAVAFLKEMQSLGYEVKVRSARKRNNLWERLF